MAAASLTTQLPAQIEPKYQTPPAELAALVNAPLTPDIRINSKGEYMVLLGRASQPSIADLSQPELRLAGIRINPANNGPSRGEKYNNITLKEIQTLKEIPLQGLPNNVSISNVSWSPDESKIAFTQSDDKAIYLGVLDIATRQVQMYKQIPLNATYGSSYVWHTDSKSIIAKRVPLSRGSAPEVSRIPLGPTIQENLGRETMAPTYQDLLKNDQDVKMFDYYFQSEIVRISLADQQVTALTGANIYTGFSVSPNGQYLLVNSLKKPFSYLVPAYYFPSEITVLSTTDGSLVKQVHQRALVENIPWNRDDVMAGPRSFAWRDDEPATLYWVEALDGGSAKKQTSERDALFTLAAPFTGEPQRLFTSSYRIGGATWATNTQALIHEGWWATRKSVVSLINPSKPSEKATLFDRSSDDRYNAPGAAVLKKNQFNRYVLDIDKRNNILLIGDGASPEGDKPFLDEFNLVTKQKNRLWQSQAPVFEQPYVVLDREKKIILTSRETPEEIPNFYIRHLQPGKKQNPLKQITDFPHPYPAYKNVQKQLLRYKRNDGVELTATLYLPVGYKKEDGPLPTFLWAYPREFKNKNSAGQVTGSPYKFNRISYQGAAAFVTRGYAILDNAAIPIIGEGDQEPNDTYVQQLVASAQAAIEEGVRLGVTDPERVGVGGHSYGAFMTANLLTHSNLFKAGIARSGAYNRTLTPFGFQNEQRTYWKAPEVYNAMSPFMNADKMKTPLLLIHGEADNNTGTFPMQSERYYAALKAMGATTRLVVLPYESHGYVAKESLLHMLWETDQWLEKYVKNYQKK